MARRAGSSRPCPDRGMARGGRASFRDRRPLPRRTPARRGPHERRLGRLSDGLARSRRPPKPGAGSDRSGGCGVVAARSRHLGDRLSSAGARRRLAGHARDRLATTGRPSGDAFASDRRIAPPRFDAGRRRLLEPAGPRPSRRTPVAAGRLRPSGRRRRPGRSRAGRRSHHRPHHALASPGGLRTLRGTGLGHRGGKPEGDGARRARGLHQLLWRRRRRRRASLRGGGRGAERRSARDRSQAGRGDLRRGLHHPGLRTPSRPPRGGPGL